MLNCCARSLRVLCADGDAAIQAPQVQEAAANAAAQREAADAAMKAAFRQWRRGRRAANDEGVENTFMDWYMGELERENEELRKLAQWMPQLLDALDRAQDWTVLSQCEGCWCKKPRCRCPFAGWQDALRVVVDSVRGQELCSSYV